MKVNLLKAFTASLVCIVLSLSAKAATYTWVGGTGTNWTTASNWTVSGATATTYPGQSPTNNTNTDIVQIGVANSTLTNFPVISANASIYVASIALGPYGKSGTPTSTFLTSLTVNGTLNVSGDISQVANTAKTEVNNFLMGSGTINCSSITVGNNTAVGGSNNFLFSYISNLNVSGNVNIIISVAIVNGSGFRLENGKMSIGGQITITKPFAGTSQNAGYFTINGTASTGNAPGVASDAKTNPSLYLLNSNPIATIPTPYGSVNFNGNRKGGTSGGSITVYYTGASPTIYTASYIGFGSGGGNYNATTPHYDNLVVNGTGTAVIGTTPGTSTPSALLVDSALTTTSPVTFNSFSTATTIGTNWSNSSTITGGAGSTDINGSLSNSGTMTMSTGAINIAGNYTNTSVFQPGTGLITFDGSTAQSLTDNSTAGTAFRNVAFINAGLKTIVSGTGNFAVATTGILSMTSPAKLIAGSNTTPYLTLLSDGTSTATIAAMSGYTSPLSATNIPISGVVNVQRFMTGGTGYRGYRLMSPPVNISSSVTGNYSLAYLNANASFGGTTYHGAITAGQGSGFTVANNNPIIYLYDESRTTDNSTFVAGKNVGIYSITGNTVTTISGKPAVQTPNVSIPVGNSVLFYYIGVNTNTSNIKSTRVPENSTITATGYLNQGDIPVFFWNTKSTAIPYHTGTGATLPGYNQIGNPYASTIALDAFYNDNKATGIDPIFWEMDSRNSTYLSYNATSTTTSSTRQGKYVVSGQGFIVRATNTGQTVTFKETQKVAYPGLTSTSTPTLLMGIPKQTEPVLTGLHLQLTKDSIVNTQTGIYFRNDWKDQFDSAEDALDLDGTAPQVYLSSYSTDNSRLSINQMADYSKGKRVRLFVKATTSGLYQINLVDMSNIDTLYDVFLKDKYRKDSLDIRRYGTYNFNLSTTDTSTFGANRFELVIRRRQLAQYQLRSFTAQKVVEGVLISWLTNNEGTYTGFNLEKLENGTSQFNTLYTKQSDGSGKYSFIDRTPNLTGNNVYRLKQDDIDDNITYSKTIFINYNAADALQSVSVYPNPAKEIMQVSLQGQPSDAIFSVNIYNAAGNIVLRKSVEGNTWSQEVSSLNPGSYIIEIRNNKGVIAGKAKFIKVQ